MSNRESREILLDDVKSVGHPEVVINVPQLDVEAQLQLPEERFEHRNLLSDCRPVNPAVNWTRLGILLCVVYNLFIVVILLGTYIHSKLTQ